MSQDTQVTTNEEKSLMVKIQDYINTKTVALVAMLVSLGITNPAHAQAEFQEFQDAIEGFAGGPFAIGISLIALVLGAIAGVAKLTAWPALVGFAIAAVFAIGPYVITQIFDLFAL